MSGLKKFRYKLMMLVVVVLMMTGILFLSFQLTNNSRNEDIISCSIGAEAFQDDAAVESLFKQESRLITVENFHAGKLNNNRELYVYLPPSYYNKPSKKYPVLYVQDGKAVFYLSDWSKESLNMHLKADVLISKGAIDEVIIVGISNMGDQRSSEYVHWDGIDGIPVKGKGDLYEDFVINDVKPFVEANFKVKSGRENTAIMGASLGGFVSFNIGMRNPEVFSKIAIQSPFLGWGEEQLLDKIIEGEYKTKRHLKLWMDMGSEESEFMTVMRKVVKALLAQGYKPIEELAVFEVPGGIHREGSWAERVEDILIYFYGKTGEPLQLELKASEEISISEQKNGVYKHINPIVTYSSGMRATDQTGSCIADDQGIAEIDDFGTINAKKEGTANLTYKTSTDLTDTITINIVK